MSARVLDGREVAAVLKEELRAEVAGRSLKLAIVRGGGDEAAEMYARRLEALSAELGVGTRVAEVPDGASSESGAYWSDGDSFCPSWIPHHSRCASACALARSGWSL